ncbi:MAG: hypothetical protein UW09_C0003G0230 [candidate division TM6 bacterium GW2011_GWF2_43_87]|nr:MAG: hypothetical protein UW09_C0003G0230 [candidate division TM6 bacterium GW2011_GWF2_43_87]
MAYFSGVCEKNFLRNLVSSLVALERSIVPEKALIYRLKSVRSAQSVVVSFVLLFSSENSESVGQLSVGSLSSKLRRLISKDIASLSAKSAFVQGNRNPSVMRIRTSRGWLSVKAK